MRLALALLLAFAPIAAAAQATLPPRLAEPYMTDTPFGDFPVGRLEPGARLRLTGRDGRRIELRLLALRDTTLDVIAADGSPRRALTYEELRAERLVEVRAVAARNAPGARLRTAGWVVGLAAVGAVIGAQRDNRMTARHGPDHKPGRAETIAVHVGTGAFLGWITDRMVSNRPRWRPVTFP